MRPDATVPVRGLRAGWGGWAAFAGTVAVLLLPSVAWSLVYREPKIVLDVLPLYALECWLAPRWRVLLRALWTLACAVTLLLEWNIFPESYWFYAKMWAGVAGSGQGTASILAFGCMAGYLVLPRLYLSWVRRRPVPLVLGCLYLLALAAKATPFGRAELVWLRVPMARAAQVVATDWRRLLHASVTGGESRAPDVAGALYREIAGAEDGTAPGKILVVLLESWGETPRSLEQLAQFLGGNGGSLERGFTRYRGSTLPGEVRELCGVALSFADIGEIGPGCLPGRLRERGYRTVAMHGYDGTFYYRQLVYPAFGFRDVRFRKDLEGRAPSCAGAFAGICDDAIVDLAIAEIAKPGNAFVYVMSLSGHEPVADEVLRRPYVGAWSPGIPESDTQRVNRALIAHVVREVCALPPEVARPLVYFAGDHQPPSGAEALGFPPGLVPYLLLRTCPAAPSAAAGMP